MFCVSFGTETILECIISCLSDKNNSQGRLYLNIIRLLSGASKIVIESLYAMFQFSERLNSCKI